MPVHRFPNLSFSSPARIHHGWLTASLFFVVRRCSTISAPWSRLPVPRPQAPTHRKPTPSALCMRDHGQAAAAALCRAGAACVPAALLWPVPALRRRRPASRPRGRGPCASAGRPGLPPRAAVFFIHDHVRTAEGKKNREVPDVIIYDFAILLLISVV